MLWYILLGVAALLLVVLCIPLSLTVSLDESGALQLVGRVLGITVYRSPERERPVKLSDYSPHALRRREKREQRRRRKALKKQQRKRNQSTAKRKTASPPDKKAALTEKLDFIKTLAEAVLSRSLKHARVDVASLAITVATPDAAETAILYGGVCAALAGLTETLHQFTHLHIRNAARYGVAADFTSERTRADIGIRFRLRVGHVLDIAWHALRRMIGRMLKKKA
jgi:hypothetical protein